MELVPIIQISLALFSGLLLLVLLISYIVFKVNKNEQTAQFHQEYGMQTDNGYYPEMRQEQSYPQMLSVYNVNPYYNGMDNQQVQAQQSPRHEYSARQGRYTVIYNEGAASGEKQACYPERSTGYKYRFAPAKNTNAFAQFK